MPAAGQSIRRAPAFAETDLVAPPTADWPTNGGDWYNRRYSPLSAINRDNVASLKGVWRTHLRGSGLGPQYSGEAQPIVYRGVAYVVTGANDVFALSVDSGEILWEYRANLEPTNNAVCCGWTSRGVGVGRREDLRRSARLEARRTRPAHRQGRVVDASRALARGLLDHERAALLRRPGLHGLRGRRARHPRPRQGVRRDDGALVWTFYTIPGPGEVGHDTWPQDNEIWMDGGAPVWNTPAVDPELRLDLFRDGQSGPRLQRLHSPRRQLVLDVDRRGRRKNGRISLALPAGASRHLGLRRRFARDAVRSRRSAASSAKVSRKRARPAGSTFSTARPASR